MLEGLAFSKHFFWIKYYAIWDQNFRASPLITSIRIWVNLWRCKPLLYQGPGEPTFIDSFRKPLFIIDIVFSATIIVFTVFILRATILFRSLMDVFIILSQSEVLKHAHQSCQNTFIIAKSACPSNAFKRIFTKKNVRRR